MVVVVATTLGMWLFFSCAECMYLYLNLTFLLFLEWCIVAVLGLMFCFRETKHLADRMKRHRQHFGANIPFCVFPMEGRTKARTTEARAIVEARRAGFTLYNLAS